jgi:hypothetical protein
LDESEYLDGYGTRKFQTLVGMAQSAVTIRRIDLSFAVSSISCFSANPRWGRLALALHMFGYIKHYPNRRICIDSTPLVVPEENQTKPDSCDFLGEYPDASEDVDPKVPTAYGTKLKTSIFFDSDHAHDQKTRRSITGLIIFVGRTPVSWYSKRQGCISTST